MRRLIVIAAVGGLLIGGGAVARQAVSEADDATRAVAARAGNPKPVVPQPTPMPPGEMYDARPYGKPPRFSVPPAPKTAVSKPFNPSNSFHEVDPDSPFANSAPIPPASVSSIEQKRNRLVALAGAYAGMLDECELDAYLADFEATVRQKRAERDLQTTRRQLQSLIARFPNTPAAAQAQRMLNANRDEAQAPATAEQPSHDERPHD